MLSIKIRMAITLPKGMKEYYGRNIDRMPEILKAGEIPMSASALMKYRINQGEDFPDLWNCWYDTSDLIIYPKGNNKEVYFLLAVNNKGKITKNGRKALELIRPGNLASNYGAIVDNIEQLEGKNLIKVSKDKLTTEKYLTREQVLNELTWRILTRYPDEVPKDFAESKNLLEDYEAKISSKTRENTNMAVYLGNSLKDVNILKAWCVYWLEYRSYAYGRYNLDNGSGRFVGICQESLILGHFPNQGFVKSPEALGAPVKGASNIKAYTIADLQAFDKAMKGLERTLHPDVLKPFADLRKKL